MIATVPVGYADGYSGIFPTGECADPRKTGPNPGKGMYGPDDGGCDRYSGCGRGDMVTLIGRDGDDRITVEELAERGNGFHYEIICGIGMRVPRVYLKGKKIVGTKDYFGDEYFGFD